MKAGEEIWYKVIINYIRDGEAIISPSEEDIHWKNNEPWIVPLASIKSSQPAIEDGIYGFSGEYRWLSNFWPAKIYYGGNWYPSVEHAYQCRKAKDDEVRSKMIVDGYDMEPGQLKKWGKKIEIVDNWTEIKLEVMEDLTRLKFANSFTKNGEPATYLKEKLIETGNRYIEETNTWNDIFWGVCNGVGENHLGKIIMKVRRELQI